MPRTRRLKSALLVIVVLHAVASALPSGPGRRSVALDDASFERSGLPLPPAAARLGPAGRRFGANGRRLRSLRDRDALVGGPGADVAALERGGEHVREAVGRAGEDRRAERGDLRRRSSWS